MALDPFPVVELLRASHEIYIAYFRERRAMFGRIFALHFFGYFFSADADGRRQFAFLLTPFFKRSLLYLVCYTLAPERMREFQVWIEKSEQ